MTWVFVALAGGLGAATRYAVDVVATARAPGELPWGTMTVNVSGSLLAGVMGGLVARHALPADLHTVVVGGFLGAYTTFSTAMLESARALDHGARAAAVANLALTLVLSVLAAIVGWWFVS